MHICKLIISNKLYLNQETRFIFLVKRVPGRGPEQRESDKTVLYPLIVVIILISYIIIIITRRVVTTESGF